MASDNSNAPKLTVMSYNVQMLFIPFYLVFNTWMRKAAIVDHILTLEKTYNVDIFILNEAFVADFYEMVTEKKVLDRFPYFTRVVGHKEKDSSKEKKRYPNGCICKNSKSRNSTFYTSDNTDDYTERAKPCKEERHLSNMQALRMNTHRLKRRHTVHSKYASDYIEKKGKATLVKFRTVTGRRKIHQVCNGGVMLLSKHKIVEAHALIYADSGFPDNVCAKGAIFAKCQVENKFINIVATHLQAGESSRDSKIRLLQIAQLSDWVYRENKTPYIRYKEPLIFVGDFNIRYKQDKKDIDIILSKSQLNASLTTRTLETTYDSSLNVYIKYIENDNEFRYKYVLDYIFVSNDYKLEIIQPQKAVQTPFKPLYFIRFVLGCFPYKTTHIHHPSDHFPIFATFRL